jgi:penicillin-binding protein 1C
MNKSSWLVIILSRIYQGFWQNRSLLTRTILLLSLSLLICRSLAYLVPIRASDIQQDEQALEFSDRYGLPLGTLLTRDRDHTAVVPLELISPRFLQAILAAEDGRFYHHGALEFRAIARSLVQALKAKKIVSGASTITMQLARMLEPAPRTLPAKVKEIWLSWRLAAGMSQDEILQAYINRLPMGGNIYGVEAASRIYFGIPATDLNLAQASLLAAIPNNPNYLNPYEGWDRLKKRQLYVLNRLTDDGYISEVQAHRAYQEEIPLQSRQQGIIAAPHFLFFVASQLSPQHSTSVRTTLDRSLQQFVEAQVKDIVYNLAERNVTQGAALVIDNDTGEVLAYVGSVDYFSQAQLGQNDGVQALRQPGSTLKPFLYQLALENKVIRPNTILADVPTHYAIPGAKIYSPSDYSETFAGPVRIRIALGNSLNVPAVRVLEKVGVSNFLNRLHQLGFDNLDQSAEYYGLGLTLGSGEVTLWQLARAYRILALQGQNYPLITTLTQPLAQNSPAIIKNPETWSLTTNILSDRHARGQAFGVDSILNLPFEAAVKTGTSSNFRDTWTIGFTTDYTVATWVGNFNGEPMQQVSGVMGAAHLWNRIMLRLHQENLPKSFSPPPRMVLRPICALSGLKPNPTCPSVAQEYFYLEELEHYETHPDNFYQLIPSSGEEESPQYRLNLPSEYNQWLATQSSSSSLPLTPRIISPRNGDYFLLEPGNGEEQQLLFQVGGISDKSVEWRLNGKTLAVDSSPSFFWQLRPGNWTLEVKAGNISDQVQFQVELAKPTLLRRGFSVISEKGDF